ncbi:mitochondrial large subunit ribosomal protein-domain-containing protein [Amylocarpus encephaloides]|uniref:Large ribosomal subunit protein mL49 n=1 Tax=Amylocarpus encephaloides TaxID=45428 RepID=A0A9P7YLN5_9HELO|nr:mitochondrial large subunit ribosomal protein-domain-containing protein [Amylocarpus encephaloides]
MSLPFLLPRGLPRASTLRLFRTTTSKPTQAVLLPLRFYSTPTSPPPRPTLETSPTPNTSDPSPSPSVPPTRSSPPTSSSSPVQSANTKPYHITLTHVGNLPIYRLSKRGGNLKLTSIKHISGDIKALSSDLQELLKEVPEESSGVKASGKGKGKDSIEVRMLGDVGAGRGELRIKGHYKQSVMEFCQMHKVGCKEVIENLL